MATRPGMRDRLSPVPASRYGAAAAACRESCPDMMNIENIEETALLTVERQDFDSDIFGRPVYRLKIRGGGKGLAEALSDLVRAWVGRDIALCVCRIPAADTDSALALEAAGFRRIECLV